MSILISVGLSRIILKKETEKRNFGYVFHYYGIDHEEVNDDLS